MQKTFETTFWSIPIEWAKKEQNSYSFYEKAETTSTRCHDELFFRTKRLSKTKLRSTVSEYIKTTHSRRRASQRRFVDSCSNIEQKISKKEMKILTHKTNEEKPWEKKRPWTT